MRCGLVVLIMMFFCGATLASAEAKDQKRDRKKDGTCQSYVIEQVREATLAADRTRTRDKKRDKSCQSYTTEKDEGMTLAADQTRDRKRKRDC